MNNTSFSPIADNLLESFHPGPTCTSGLSSSDVMSENEALAAAIELNSQLDQADRLQDAAGILADRLADIVLADRVCILWRTGDTSPMRLLADTTFDLHGSPRDRPNVQAEIAETIAAGEEIAVIGERIDWHSDRPSRRGGTLAIEQFARSTQSQSLIAIPLIDDGDGCRGVLIVVEPRSDSVSRFLDAMAPLLTGRLVAIERLQPGRLETLWRSITRSTVSPARWRMMAIAVVMFVAFLFMPATYSVSVPLELQPVMRRYVAVPFDGPLKKCRVRPGDVVAQGEVLAEIDPREIQYELVGVRSQWEQAEQARKGRIAEHDFAAGQLAELESRRLKSQTQRLIERQTNLEIKSPVAGMIVSGDWRSSEGMPLSRGETLFEVAPLDEMIVQLWIPESEIAYVRTGMTVRIATHADPDQQHVGTIEHVHPRAEIRDHDNVFVAEVRLPNRDNRLQPGMRGRGKIYSDQYAIGWNWFHRPWYALRDWVRW
ncbi:efflux RND transporter periplasmic adaptor subunit [Neorhodopirellula pilleata]|uniref:Macrolide export protein MacA n=1 Tax=Neorhodopirellula pilleata TaxID=2714738 RepID=A0A5C6AVQ5_9BACT|nr:HlyD family efflux transporter periplasmic adaptor subunit [Neorhodopirellula pilleata]TWU03830.1 Macrolide export protein MacA [Neorhodopirellula pilleata]